MGTSLLPSFTPLFAADLESFFRGIGSEFTGKKATLGWNDAGIVVGVVVVIGVIVAVLSRHLAKQEHLQVDNPRKLFRELCDAHGLKWSERRTLRKLAKFYELAPASRLFVEPKHFDEALGEHSWQASIDRLQALRERLFATSEQPA